MLIVPLAEVCIAVVWPVEVLLYLTARAEALERPVLDVALKVDFDRRRLDRLYARLVPDDPAVALLPPATQFDLALARFALDSRASRRRIRDLLHQDGARGLSTRGRRSPAAGTSSSLTGI